MSDELEQGDVTRVTVRDLRFVATTNDPGPELVLLPKGAQVHPVWPFSTEADLRRFIRQEVHAALDDIAREIRTSVAFQPTRTTHKQAGTCCACLMAGEDMEWVGYRLVHKSEECRKKAAEMPPVREHRG